MRKPQRYTALMIAMATSLCCTNVAHAGVPVFDVVNATSNIIQNFQLAAIKHTLADKGGDTINHYTNSIDNSTKNIDISTASIAVTNTSIDNSTKNIDKSTTSIEVLTQINTSISNEFTWIINHDGDGDEIVPIPDPVTEKLEDLLNGQTSDEYAARFQSAKHYVDSDEPEDFTEVGLEGSRARKAANDALVKSIEVDRDALKDEAAGLKKLETVSKGLQGHARQLQVSNALAGSQVDQLMRLRSMILVSEAARAAESQAAADKDARAMATSKAMRAGLSDARNQTIAPQPMF